MLPSIASPVIDKLSNMLHLPRPWGTTKNDGVWYRRKYNGKPDVIDSINLSKILGKIPLNVSMSNYDGENFTNFHPFIIFDFDAQPRSLNPLASITEEPTLIIYKELQDQFMLSSMVADSGGRGFHIWQFLSAPVYAKEIEKYQNIVLEHCAKKYNKTENNKVSGFIKMTNDVWTYFDASYPYNPEQEMKEQQHVEIEFDTALGDGKMMKIPFSRHATKENFFELPIPIDKIRNRNRTTPPTEQEFETAQTIISNTDTIIYRRILEIAQINEPQTEKDKKISYRQDFTHTKFKIPDRNDKDDETAFEILSRILDTPCLKLCYDTATSHRSVYYKRANIVTTLANTTSDISGQKYTREEIAYFFKYFINDDADNTHPEILPFQVDYWYQRKYNSRCDYFQETDSEKFCCDIPCGRRSPSQKDPEPDHIHLTRVSDYLDTYKKCNEILDTGFTGARTLVKKTTRAGFTTAINISAVEQKKKILFIVPRTAIAEKTFGDTICLAADKRSLTINGFVISPNIKFCLKRAMEIEQYEKLYGNPPNIKMPVPRDDCKRCEFSATIVTPNKNEPMYKCDLINMSCAQSTYRTMKTTYHAGFTTYSKIFAILNTISDEAHETLDEFLKYDIIVLDEVSLLVEGTSLEVPIYKKHRDNKLTYKFSSILNNDLEKYLRQSGGGEIPDKIHYYCALFVDNFKDYDQFKDCQKIKNPLTENDFNNLKLNMSLYLNSLYNFAITFPDAYCVESIYQTIHILSEQFWYVSKTQSMDYMSNVSFVVPPKNKQFVEWLHDYKGHLIITDATLPYQNLSKVFGTTLHEYELGDPNHTAETQLIICDSRNIMPKRIFDDVTRLKQYIEEIIKMHGPDKFMTACPNRRIWRMFSEDFEKIPADNVTYYRSEKTIGVACNLRNMITISSPYAPHNAFDWLSLDLFETKDYGQKIWHVNGRNTFFQTISRVKDPLGHTLSVVYAYGLRTNEIEHLMENCIGKPHLIEVPEMKGIINGHTIIADHWMKYGIYNMNPNEVRVLILIKNGFSDTEIRERLRVTSEFMKETKKKLFL